MRSIYKRSRGLPSTGSRIVASASTARGQLPGVGILLTLLAAFALVVASCSEPQGSGNQTAPTGAPAAPVPAAPATAPAKGVAPAATGPGTTLAPVPPTAAAASKPAAPAAAPGGASPGPASAPGAATGLPSPAPAAGGPAVVATPFFANYWGRAKLDGADVPVGAVVEVFTPRGDVVGRFVVNTAGYYGYMRVYGEDAVSKPPIPGMRAGETITFKVNGKAAATTPPAVWQSSMEPAQLDLDAR